MQRARLDCLSWRKLVIIPKGLDVVVWICPEQEAEHIGVGRGSLLPCIPQILSQGVTDKVILRPSFIAVETVCGRLGVRIVSPIQVLRWKQAEMLTPEMAT